LLIFGAMSPHRQGNQASTPSQAELREVVEKIVATCDQHVLGRKQAQGERITSAQASAIAHCIDGMGGAYIEGVKSGRR
jgi:hypothetical protein